MSQGKTSKPETPIADDLRGLGRLAVDGVSGITDLVEAMHAAITHLPAVVGKPAPTTTTGLSGFVYRRVRGVTRLVGSGLDASLSRLAPLLGSSPPSPPREAVRAAANGVLGDHLEASGNPLAIGMQFRRDGRPLPLARKPLAARLPQAGGKLLVLVHGLCMHDQQWSYGGHDHGQALARDLGYTPVYLRYNSGRHISTNGREFARSLEKLVKAWPVPVEEITLLCHSMGGLVARSALDHALNARLAWPELPQRIVFLGTPHHGAPLERAGSWADLLIGISPYSAPLVRLGKIRSAGIQDLRHGNVRDTDWQDRDGDGRADGRSPLPLPAAIAAYAIAVSTQQARKGNEGALRGDGLVPLASALGEHHDPDFDLRIPSPRRWVGYGINHLEMLGSAEVYARILHWLRSPENS
ncbi:MAG: alpha/beta hydrolase [Lysobacteraceae bacterium]|nr:MAG: alpha/beta hydrolase [Xanthomonadaceae bacterium]